MHLARTLLVLPLLAVAGQACAQISPGMNPPATVAAAVDDSLSIGCFLVVYGRPFPGLNLVLPQQTGKGLHTLAKAPDTMQPIAEMAGSDAKVATLDAKGGKGWIFFSDKNRRCIVVPDPVDAPGMEAVAAKTFAHGDLWKPIDELPGVYEARIINEPVVRGRYQPASNGLPQMIIMEQKQ
jgi:hypothetical protein